jgi:hypothetical protein
MNETGSYHLQTCPTCRGRGLCRNERHFFYAICLLGSGAVTLFQWPPVPELFALLSGAFARAGLPLWIGTVVIWVLTLIPVVFGFAFLVAWLRQDTCPECNGRCKTSCEA